MISVQKKKEVPQSSVAWTRGSLDSVRRTPPPPPCPILSARMVLVHERPVRAPLVGASTWLRLYSVGSVLVFMTPAVVHSLPLGPDDLDLQLWW